MVALEQATEKLKIAPQSDLLNFQSHGRHTELGNELQIAKRFPPGQISRLVHSAECLTRMKRKLFKNTFRGGTIR